MGGNNPSLCKVLLLLPSLSGSCLRIPCFKDATLAAVRVSILFVIGL